MRCWGRGSRSGSAPRHRSSVLENDDFTPMEFVVEALQENLGLSLKSAVRVMLQVHHEGRAIAYPDSGYTSTLRRCAS